ncbi:spermidine synthase [Hydrogenispora ethanolica]|uniref:Polyamine aminopropyltransferase n=1 Tax=Hydrogenispora ethanolica TaxID=1082276 RepID=A0A4V2QD71_HYDET|nr:polyamine aminopropyltransferase [Hydrogenispora ethanolica]TCL62767.1 spermidine synthase [Hydrogenispora ethanolica]
MELWYTEQQTPNLGLSCKINRTLHVEKTEYQDLAVIDTIQYGRMLVLDGMVMTTEVDEFVYHEMITHVALNTHPRPERVLVVGGGDGGAIREIIKHTSVKEAVLGEIDRRVVEVSQEYLPSIAGALTDARVTLAIGDGVEHVRQSKGKYDVILVDSTEPIGPAVGLFSREFYQDVYEALTPDGIMVAQSESPFVNQDVIRMIHTNLQGVFPIKHLYLASIPTYPSGLWSFTLASKKWDPLQADPATFQAMETKYYTPDVHFGAFKLPKFAADLVK